LQLQHSVFVNARKHDETDHRVTILSHSRSNVRHTPPGDIRGSFALRSRVIKCLIRMMPGALAHLAAIAAAARVAA
jgi:hypothetical protein